MEFMMKDLLKISDLSRQDIENILSLAVHVKKIPYKYSKLLKSESVVLYFNKPSTRTRISFETAIARLGGLPITVRADELQLGRGETIEDTAKVISRYARAFIVRTYKDEDIERFASAATIPVINALSDLHHPLQSLADIMTIQERFNDWHACKVAYVGDGNNVAHSLIEAAALMGINLTLATPPEYQPCKVILTRAQAIAKRMNSHVTLIHEPIMAVAQADVVYTDTWFSMGTLEKEHAARAKAFKAYQVNEKLMQHAAKRAIFMHCLPDHRGEEVTASVIDGPQSVVFDQAENRLHTAQAVLIYYVKNYLKGSAK